MEENKTEIEKAFEAQANHNLQMALAQQDKYGSIINWRSSKIDDWRHKDKVLSGYAKIVGLVLK